MSSNNLKEMSLPKWKAYDYEILPIYVMYGEPFSKGIFTYTIDYFEPMALHGGSFFIKGVEGLNILVDSGPTVEDFHNHGFPATSIKPMAEALEAATGLKPDDIDVVIFTQLHHDHCPCANLFKNAKFIVQKAEWDSCHNPPACYRTLYNPEYVDGIKPTFVEGDVIELYPGISLLSTPGHTLGSQSISVDTVDGRVIICGLCCNEDNFNPRDDLKETWPEVLVPGLHVDNEEAYQSMLRVKREADYIITLHDKKSFERGVCPSSLWPKYK
jgi:glyoxylase-like metal-dependent hydrolase (beta-lactamase superfamily II)